MPEKLHNYFYKITNLINGKYYYGIHSTNNLEDGYKGGGTYLRRSIKKHGWENFKKEIIVDYPTRKEVSDYEREIVTIELIQLDECYNCRTGGDNEFIYPMTEERRRAISESLIGEKHPNFGKYPSEETRRKLSLSNKGKVRNEETKQKISLAQTGENHHMFGKKGIDNPNFGSKRDDVSKQKMSLAQSGEKNHFYGKSHSEETKQKMRESRKKRSHTCIVFGVVYNSFLEASKLLGIPTSTLRRKIKAEVNND